MEVVRVPKAEGTLPKIWMLKVLRRLENPTLNLKIIYTYTVKSILGAIC